MLHCAAARYEIKELFLSFFTFCLLQGCLLQHLYRAARRNTPTKDDTLVSSKEQAQELITKLERQIANKKTPKQHKAVYLCARAVLYEALGDRKMLEAARDAHRFSKTAQSTALVAVALHHFGRIKESLQWYEQSWRYPHEPGFEIDIGYSGALLFQPDKWQQAWPIVKSLKKRMVYAAYLPFWDGKPCKEVSVLSEGGFGDLIHNSRYLPLLPVEKVTVYLPKYFFDSGFVDLCKRQPWFPEIKLLSEVPMHVPAAGFFDLPAIFNSTPETVPASPVWQAKPLDWHGERPYLKGNPNVGFCWAARAMETPLCPDGVYRSLTGEQARQIIRTADFLNWVALQKEFDSVAAESNIDTPALQSWEDTAAIIANLDLVVTVDTGVMHLAAAMGKPTWVILSGAVDWKFGLEGERCVWYPTMRLFRNNDFGFGNSVQQVGEALGALSNRAQ